MRGRMQPLNASLPGFIHMRIHSLPSAVDIAICDSLQHLAVVSERSGCGTRSAPAETAELNKHVTDRS